MIDIVDGTENTIRENMAMVIKGGSANQISSGAAAAVRII
jgi:hypothetical protein